MKKTICRALLCLLLAACLLPLTARTAHADKIYDEIVNYQVDVTPNTEDGSLAIQVTLDWKPLEDLPATNSQKGGAKIGIPNGSIREMTALTDNIQSIAHDNSYAYIDFTQGYSANETFHFAFRWVQEYMYTLSDSGAVSYDYTPGWFDGAPVDVMTLTWHDPASVAGVGSDGQTGGDHVLTASNMKPGDRLNFTVEYASWPSTLYWENSRDNLPDNSRGDDSYDDSDDSDNWVFTVFVIFVRQKRCSIDKFWTSMPQVLTMTLELMPQSFSLKSCKISCTMLLMGIQRQKLSMSVRMPTNHLWA